jgi:hypothetical protein
MLRLICPAVIAAACLVAGCATPGRVEQMSVPGVVGINITAPQALRESIAMGEVTGGEETNPLWTSQVSGPDFAKALESSLLRAGLLQPDRKAGRYVLSAKLAELDQPLAGFNMTVTASVTYTLIARPTTQTVWEKKLTTPYTASFGDALYAVERLKLANEGAIRANISELLIALYRLRP